MKADPAAHLGDYEMTIVGSVDGVVQNKTFLLRVISSFVAIDGLSFHPGNLRVIVGSTVLWMNLEGAVSHYDPGTHDVVSVDGGARSSPLAKFDTFSFTFSTAGIFRYYCSYHRGMYGLIEVTGL
jgi:plastocyanin